MEVKINQVVLHLLDPGASEPVLSDRAMDMDADLYEYYTATLERAFARRGKELPVPAGLRFCRGDGAESGFHRSVPPHCGRHL